MNMTAKTAKRAAAVLVLTAAVFVAAYRLSYPIELNMATLPEQIAAFHNRESEDWDPSEITVYGGVSVGDREYYLLPDGDGGVSGQRHPEARPDRAV